ncbi:MAG: BMC domain-containing protein [Fusobacteriaceae bacterium]
MESIGLIETRGLLAAIESADVMAKSANIKILEKIYVGGGLVSITICGDVGAVKSAVEAGASAVKRLGESLLVSNHVIARPHEELGSIIKVDSLIEKEESALEEVLTAIKVVETNDEKELEEKFQSELNFESEICFESSCKDEILNCEVEEITSKKIENIDYKNIIDSLVKEKIDQLASENKMIEIEKSLKESKISMLRKLIKEYKSFTLASKSISKLSKEDLIKKILDYYKKSN